MLRTTQYICEEDKHYALVRLGRQGAFKSTTVYYVRAGKGLSKKGGVHRGRMSAVVKVNLRFTLEQAMQAQRGVDV